MSLAFTFNNSVPRVVLTPLPLKASAGEKESADAPVSKQTWPWEALPLVIHRCLNNSKSGRPTPTAALLYGADRASRGLLYLVAVGIAAYLFSFNYVLSAPIQGRDWFVWLVLGAWYFTLALQMFSMLFGRYRNHPASLSINEYLDNEELQLPALLWNYQLFGMQRSRGLLASGIVTIIVVTNALAWGATITACASRMLINDPFSPIYAVVWGALTLQHLLAALARSVNFAELRSSVGKETDPPTPIERARMTLVSGYIFWVVCVQLPLSAAGLLYVQS